MSMTLEPGDVAELVSLISPERLGGLVLLTGS